METCARSTITLPFITASRVSRRSLKVSGPFVVLIFQTCRCFSTRECNILIMHDYAEIHKL
jgi:hypothetical protein